MTKHVLQKAQAICEMTFFVESVDEMARSAYRGVDCAACLRKALLAVEQRALVIRQMLAKVEMEANLLTKTEAEL